ncbi:MAG: NADH-quinone oxidoreductase subunit C [Desulfobacteraceae bacterium]|nr:NADH-quinone oxidoreductase subunit C [Desulfobacteraceae bacterium]
MKADEMEKALREEFPGALFAVDESGRNGVRYSVLIALSGMRKAAQILNAAGFFLETITALDFSDTFELVYHFNCYEPKSRIALRALCGKDQTPSSLVDTFRGAGWLEREVHDFFGISFSGNPDMRSLLLPEDADYHPLLKSFGKSGDSHKREDIYGK